MYSVTGLNRKTGRKKRIGILIAGVKHSDEYAQCRLPPYHAWCRYAAWSPSSCWCSRQTHICSLLPPCLRIEVVVQPATEHGLFLPVTAVFAVHCRNATIQKVCWWRILQARRFYMRALFSTGATCLRTCGAAFLLAHFPAAAAVLFAHRPRAVTAVVHLLNEGASPSMSVAHPTCSSSLPQSTPLSCCRVSCTSLA